MAIRSEAPDLAVDELKRRARRRLVGAVVLALAAAVILPLLLESDPKPLGDEVSVRIPPVDNSKFVNPLSPDAALPANPTAPSDAKSPAKKSIAEAERRALGQPPLTSKTDARAPADATKADAVTAKANEPAASSSTARTSELSPAKTETPVTTEQAPKADTSPKADAPAKADTPTKVDAPAKAEAPVKSTAPAPKPASPPKSDGIAVAGAFAVQVGAFADSKVAADLAAQVKAGGYAAYVEAVPTTHGTVRRVRVGPFTTRGDADAALAKLKAAGYDRALVIPAK